MIDEKHEHSWGCSSSGHGVSHLSFGVNIHGFFKEEIHMFGEMEGRADFCYYQKLYAFKYIYGCIYEFICIYELN